MKPIYVPKGKAKEYGDYALNIYTGCPHECFYCFAPSVLRREKEKFHGCVEPRANIVEETKKQLEESMTDKFRVKKLPSGRKPKGQTAKIKSNSKESNAIKLVKERL